MDLKCVSNGIAGLVKVRASNADSNADSSANKMNTTPAAVTAPD
jgi:hypothetical protein